MIKHKNAALSLRARGEAARMEGITRSFVNRLLRLTLLAPDIQEAILDGRQPKGMQLEELTRAMPIVWEEHRAIAKKFVPIPTSFRPADPPRVT